MKITWKKTWRKTCACLCLSLFAAALPGCSGGGGEQQTAASAVSDGVLTVGIIDGQDAYARQTEEGFAGIEPEILNSLGASLEILVEYKTASSVQELMELLDGGSIDLAAGRLSLAETYVNGRIQSRNYAKRGLYLVTVKDSYVDTLAGFSDVNVAVSQDIPTSTLLEVPYLDRVQHIPGEDLAGIGEDIEKGVIKGAILTEREALSLLSGGNVRAAEIRNSPKMEAVFYMAESQTELKAYVDQAINAFLDAQAEAEVE